MVSACFPAMVDEALPQLWLVDFLDLDVDSNLLLPAAE